MIIDHYTQAKKKVTGKFKDELNGKILTELCSPMAKTYAFTADNDTELKLAKGTKQFVINIGLHLRTIKNQYLKIKQY